MAITYGAGVSTDEAYTFAYDNGVLFVGSTVSTIGALGGWLLNGGHGVLTGSHGLAVDRALQFTIVTPDSRVRVANRCVNPDLFWALRGGGGGSFGFVLSATVQVDVDPPITAVVLSVPDSADNQRSWVSLLAENMPAWALEGWGGPSTTNMSLISNPFLNVSQAEASLAPGIKFVQSHNGSVTINAFDSFFDYWIKVVNGSLAAPQPTSTAILSTSRTVPEKNFQDDSSRQKMVDAIVDAQTAGLSLSMLAVPPLLYARDHPDPETSIHPAWYESVWLIVAQTGWKPESLLSIRKDAVALLRSTTENLIAAVPEGCAYANEADPWLEDWSVQVWGKNYDRLLEVKRRVDPYGLLSCWHCVGYDELMSDYECVSKLS